MSISDSAILEVDNPRNVEVGSNDTSLGLDMDTASSAASQLQFQDFPRNQGHSQQTSHSLVKGPSVGSFNTSLGEEVGSPDDDEENDVLLGSGVGGKAKSAPAFWELSYFAKYFDVTASDVLSRILWSVLPITRRNASGGRSNYVERHIQNNPDLYGPFWINVTLVFSIAICGNISNYLSSGGDPDKWHYDFNKVGLAASTILTYTVGVPLTLWFFFWFRGCTASYTLLETICAYGYSLSVYVPISVLWMIGVRILQYVLVITGALLSGSVLVLAFAPVVKSDPGQAFKSSYIILLAIIALHALVTFSFLAYFF